MIRELERDAWTRRLAKLGLEDAYFAYGYVEAAAHLEGGRAALLALRDDRGDVVFPCVVRPLPDGAPGTDVVTPYGYGGPVAFGEDPPILEFESAYDAWCRENGVVTTFIRFHPLLKNHFRAPRGTILTRLAGTITWRVDAGRDLLAGTQPTVARAIRSMDKRATVTAARGPEALERFRPLYEQTMRRIEAAPFYHFPDAYWRTLERELDERIVFIEVREKDVLLASMLVLEGRPWLHCHLLGMSDAGRTTQAGKLVYYGVARWAQERGLQAVHLGGGVGGADDSLLAFKSHFATDGLTPAYVGKIVHDGVAYCELSGSSAVDGFFPAYRRVAVDACARP